MHFARGLPLCSWQALQCCFRNCWMARPSIPSLLQNSSFYLPNHQFLGLQLRIHLHLTHAKSLEELANQAELRGVVALQRRVHTFFQFPAHYNLQFVLALHTACVHLSGVSWWIMVQAGKLQTSAGSGIAVGPSGLFGERSCHFKCHCSGLSSEVPCWRDTLTRPMLASLCLLGLGIVART